MVMSDSPVEGLDFAAALAQYQIEKIYQRILKVYVASTPEILAQLAAFDVTRLEDYITTVHGLKGASYGIQANPVGDLAKELEFAGKEGNVALVAEKNDALIAETSALIERIAAYLTTAA
jgi:HPt (histidine-containing phosphotransfer) domain-containing protein